MWKKTMSALLDRSIYYSFDATGYARHAQAFDPEDDRANLAGMRCLVTGANSGIGRATALALARSGAEVHLLCRNAIRGEEARAAIARQCGGCAPRLALVDMSNFSSIRKVVSGDLPAQVDVVVHNAGALLPGHVLTEDGLEMTWATHVAGPFLLTKLLAPRLATDARVIFVSSGGMYSQRLDLADVGWEKRAFDGVVAYAQAKRAQVILARLWGERLGPGRLVAAMHPGWVDTPGVEQALPRFYRFARKRLRTPEQGADTAVWLAKAPGGKLRSGEFWFDRSPAPAHLFRRTQETPVEREALWALCEAQTAIVHDPVAASS